MLFCCFKCFFFIQIQSIFNVFNNNPINNEKKIWNTLYKFSLCGNLINIDS